jgi:PAP2 superfamily
MCNPRLARWLSNPVRGNSRLEASSRPYLLHYVLVGFAVVLVAVLLQATPPKGWAACFFAGAPILLAVRCPSRRVWLANAVLATVITGYHRYVHGAGVPWIISIAFGAGSGSVLLALARALVTKGNDRADRFRTAAVVSMFPIKLYLGMTILPLAALLSPMTYDTILTGVDHSLGGHASFAIGRLLSAYWPLRLVIGYAYDGLPIAIMTAAALRWKRYGASDAASIPLGAAVAAALGCILYLLVPAAGPVFLWGARFPQRPPSSDELNIVLSTLDQHIFRNAMPSLHFTGALMVAWGTWSLGWAQRAFGVTFLLLTGLATLGLGQHYAVDLIVAVPFAAAIEMAVRQRTGWWRVTATGAAVTLGWCVLLRSAPQFLVVPGATWALAALTLVSVPAAMSWGAMLERVRVPIQEPSPL